jgi:hypothetical protein
MRAGWSVYYRKAKGPKSTESPEQPAESKDSGKPRTPKARMSVAVTSIEGIDIAGVTDLAALEQDLRETRKTIDVNRPGSDGGSGYWISTSGWSVRFVA